jgi:hypothetical protein
MRMPRPFLPLAGLALGLGVVAARLPAAEPADSPLLLPRCPDDAAAVALSQRQVGKPLTLDNEVQVDAGPWTLDGDSNIVELTDRVVSRAIASCRPTMCASISSNAASM